ncbi:IS1634 family transposase [uncultured Thiodictyon sp.]|uniref:IS1634 family transposase n=1 Tax=uncultured Thiodictyon sp. TaxID=1846217 RepID=UPI0025EC41F9|nr:IS1634 family transposase [uncultured Thiodictyon sp.]
MDSPPGCVRYSLHRKMFLRANKRFKDGKEHRYWSVVENRRVTGGGSVQKTLLYLGEINDSDRAAWTRAIESVDERDHARQIHLFPEDRTPDPRLEHSSIKLRLDRIELSRPRQWGGCWLALELWHRLDLDAFWQPLLPDSQKGTPWLKVLKTLVAYRLLDPGSEWKLHRCWFDRSAMADLLDDDFRLAAKDTLYRCHDRLLDHREALFTHLKDRWSGLFAASYDILLYDLTSTYFEVDANGPLTEASRLKAFGYSRDKRPDCVQIVIALIITPDGLPIGYEVMRGNTSDKTTLADMLKKITDRYGKERRTWIMDRGIPTEETLAQMRQANPAVRYLVGTPKGRLTKLEKDLATKDWQQVKDDVHVKLLSRDGELYVLARSLPRRNKESAMRRKKLKAYWARLKELQKRDKLTRDELLLAIGAAKEKAGRNAHRLVMLHLPGSEEQISADTFRFELNREKLKATRRHEGQYLLRSNLTGENPTELWRNYINLVRIEESFRTFKGDLGLRPVFHQLDGRIEAHVFISFLAYCLHVTLEQYNKKVATGLSSRSVLERMSEIQMLDVTIPATDGRELRMKRYTKPEKVHQLLLDQLGFTLPAQPPPEIRNPMPVVETF